MYKLKRKIFSLKAFLCLIVLLSAGFAIFLSPTTYEVIIEEPEEMMAAEIVLPGDRIDVFVKRSGVWKKLVGRALVTSTNSPLDNSKKFELQINQFKSIKLKLNSGFEKRISLSL